MIIFSLYEDHNKLDISQYKFRTTFLIDWLDEHGWRYEHKNFEENGVKLYVLLIDSNVKSQINYFVRNFELPKKNFKFIYGGHIPK